MRLKFKTPEFQYLFFSFHWLMMQLMLGKFLSLSVPGISLSGRWQQEHLPTYLSAAMRINRHKRCQCPCRELLSAMRYKVLFFDYYKSQALLKSRALGKLSVDGHEILPVISPSCLSGASACPRRTLNQGHEFPAHGDPSAIPVHQILISVSDILAFVGLCLAP